MFKNIKHSFLAGSILFSLLGAYYLFLGIGAPISKGLPAVLPVFAVLIFAIWMKNTNPLYRMDRAARKNLIKPYQRGHSHKALLSVIFIAVIFGVIGISLLLGAGAVQAFYIGMGFPVMLYGLVSLNVSYRMQQKAG